MEFGQPGVLGLRVLGVVGEESHSRLDIVFLDQQTQGTYVFTDFKSLTNDTIGTDD